MNAASLSSVKPNQSFRVGPVVTDRTGEAARIIIRVMTEVYPQHDPALIRSKTQGLAETYLQPGDACLLAVFDDRDQMVATAAIKPYDGRIREMQGFWSAAGTAELERVYVLPELRRAGLGGLLARASEEFCQSAGYSSICLHTHRFLAGALEFWSRLGYTVTARLAG